MTTMEILPFGCSQPAIPSNSSDNFLGNTIEEKTRRILGWTENYTPSFVPQTAYARRLERAKKSRSAAKHASEPYPYSLLNNFEKNRRKSSTSSVSSTCSSVASAGGSDSFYIRQLTPPPSPKVSQSGSPTGVTITSMPTRCQPSAALPPPPSYQKIAKNFSQPSAASTPSPVACHIGNGHSLFPVSPISPNTASPYPCNSPLPTTCRPIGGRVTAQEAFERLRKLLPNLSTEQSKYRALIQTVAHVIELETKLAQLKAETRGLNDILVNRQVQSQAESTMQPIGPSPPLQQSVIPEQHSPPLTSVYGPAVTQSPVPDDLLNIDVSAFKSLVDPNIPVMSSQSSNYHSRQSEAALDWDGPSLDASNELFSCLEFSASSGMDPLCVDTSYGHIYNR